MKHIKAQFITLLFLTLILPAFTQITEIGVASFYADKFDGRVTASGETFDQNKMTAAHRTFPFGTVVKVTNSENNKTVTVTINDRGPFVKDRVIDLSKAAAKKLEFGSSGIAQVKVEVISLGKSDEEPKSTIKSEPVVEANPSKNNNEATSVAVTAPVAAAKSTAPSPEYSTQNMIYEYYKISSELTAPAGFGIQIASYQEAANLLKRCDEIRKELNKELIIQVGENNGSKIYRIIVGPFASREAATDYNYNLKKSYPGSFVLEF